MGGVGDGTVLEYVEVIAGQDDGFGSAAQLTRSISFLRITTMMPSITTKGSVVLASSGQSFKRTMAVMAIKAVNSTVMTKLVQGQICYL